MKKINKVFSVILSFVLIGMLAYMSFASNERVIIPDKYIGRITFTLKDEYNDILAEELNIDGIEIIEQTFDSKNYFVKNPVKNVDEIVIKLKENKFIEYASFCGLVPNTENTVVDMNLFVSIKSDYYDHEFIADDFGIDGVSVLRVINDYKEKQTKTVVINVDNLNDEDIFDTYEALLNKDFVSFVEFNRFFNGVVMSVYGDIDNDGKVTPMNARKVLRVSAKLDEFSSDSQFECADIDHDKKITVTDARHILRTSAKLEKEILYMPKIPDGYFVPMDA